MAILYANSNVKHNGELIGKGSFFEAEAGEFAQLIADGAFRVVEGAKTVKEAELVLAGESEAKAQEEQKQVSTAAHDTWGPRKDDAAPEAPVPVVDAPADVVPPGAVGVGDVAPDGANL